MASIQVLQHVVAEGAGRIAGIARALGLGVVVHEVFGRDPVPSAIPDGDVLIVMGGPMGVGDIGDERWPFLVPEAALIARLLEREQPVLGVCLGAQLMAHALGARVYPLEVGAPPVRHREVGWGPVAFVAHGEEAVLDGVGPSEVVLHWHGDTFDLPRGATHLASTLACPNQMFRFGRRAFGAQFHLELDAPDIEAWVTGDADFVRAANGPRGGERILAETPRFLPRARAVGDRLITNMLTIATDPRGA